jgi:hypothetical protein
LLLLRKGNKVSPSFLPSFLLSAHSGAPATGDFYNLFVFAKRTGLLQKVTKEKIYLSLPKVMAAARDMDQGSLSSA